MKRNLNSNYDIFRKNLDSILFAGVFPVGVLPVGFLSWFQMTHLIFMDDLKLFESYEKEAETLTNIDRVVTEDIVIQCRFYNVHMSK